MITSHTLGVCAARYGVVHSPTVHRTLVIIVTAELRDAPSPTVGPACGRWGIPCVGEGLGPYKAHGARGPTAQGRLVDISWAEIECGHWPARAAGRSALRALLQVAILPAQVQAQKAGGQGVVGRLDLLCYHDRHDRHATAAAATRSDGWLRWWWTLRRGVRRCWRRVWRFERWRWHLSGWRWSG